MTFADFDLARPCLAALKSQRITEPTPVQAQAIPPALEGRDVTAIAQTGTGKTLAFALPALTHLSKQRSARNSLLILTPTRELAHQINRVIEPIGKTMGLHSMCIYGGTPIRPQINQLRRGVGVIIATPGRLLDHVNRGTVKLNKVSTVVLDEADRMLDMGFLPDIKRILSELPRERRTWMFSATFPKNIQSLTKDFQKDPVRIEVAPPATSAKNVDQSLYTVAQDDKMRLLEKVLDKDEVESAIVFIRTKHRTDRVARSLHSSGIKAKAIHGGLSQNQRQQALDGFRRGRYSVLVATDVAARGLDIDGVSHVVNYDIPASYDDYVHRIGRTGRASAKGDAITFATPHDFKELGNLERSLDKPLPRTDWDGSVHVKSAKHGDSSSGRKSSGRRSGGGSGRPRHSGPRGNRQGNGGQRSERQGNGGSRSERQGNGGSRSERHSNGGSRSEHRSNGAAPQGNRRRSNQNSNERPQSNGGQPSRRRRTRRGSQQRTA